MLTTLDIADDVLSAVQNLAEKAGTTPGQVMSELARSALRRTSAGSSRNGAPLLQVKQPGVQVTMELINALRDEAL